MPIPTRLSSYLDQRGARDEICVLLRMSHDQFHALMRAQRHGHFCGDPIH